MPGTPFTTPWSLSPYNPLQSLQVVAQQLQQVQWAESVQQQQLQQVLQLLHIVPQQIQQLQQAIQGLYQQIAYSGQASPFGVATFGQPLQSAIFGTPFAAVPPMASSQIAIPQPGTVM
jgi:hypothetical protein